jgi:hypothetical protein
MVRTRGALLSLDASGTLAKTLIHSSCRGTPYTKRHVIPRDPKTQKQLAGRAAMRWIQNAWPKVSAANRLTWAALAEQDNLPLYQAFLRYNLRRVYLLEAPSPIYPPAAVLTAGDYDYSEFLPGVRQIHIHFRLGNLNESWALAYYRSTTPNFTTKPEHLIYGSATMTLNVIYDDTDVTPGVSYYYNIRHYGPDGAWGEHQWFAPRIPLP